MIKSEKYEQLYAQIVSLIEGEDDEVTIMANASAAIHETFDDFFWTGFYVVKNGKAALRTVSGHGGLHKDCLRSWRVRHGMGRESHHCSAGCGSIPRTYSLQFTVSL
jgi:putative methionine-R-sulfoxide reductase with GAF domain